MRLALAIALTFAFTLLLSGCAGAPRVSGQDPAGRSFVLEKELIGRGSGSGVFKNTLSGSERRFKVAFDGRRTKAGLTLAEDIAYADGEKERHVWRFTRTGPTNYEGRRDDVVGVAKGTVSGNTLTLSYDVKLNTGGSTAQVHFDDTLVLVGPGRVVNKAQVSKLGLPIGKVDLSFRIGER